MYQEKKLLSIIFLILFLLMAPKINAKTCCTRHVTVAISGSAVEADLAMAMWMSSFAGECPVLIVGPGGCIDYQFKGVLFSGPVGKLDMKLIDCVHNTVVKEASITWPCVSFPNSCIDIMMNFIASFAAYFQPLDKIIFDYERIPEHCEIELEQEEVSPGQEIQVKLSDITNAERRKSREFNRIVVSASTGEIIGGTELYSDPKFKAFRVGEGSITFTYKAPDTEDNPGNTDDTIYVYNSCDILPEYLSSMSSTKFRDKIAEKTIELIHADTELTITSILQKHTEGHDPRENGIVDYENNSEIQVTIKATFEYDDTYSDEGEYEEQYNLKSWQIIMGNGNLKWHSREFSWHEEHDGRCTSESIKTSKATATNFRKDDGVDLGMSIFFDSKTGKAIRVDTCSFPVYYKWIGQRKEKATEGGACTHRVVWDEQYEINSENMFYFTGVGPFPGFEEVKSGDGVNEIGGNGTYRFTPGYDQLTVKWNVKRHIKK